jgi:hypothetical protein
VWRNVAHGRAVRCDGSWHAWGGDGYPCRAHAPRSRPWPLERAYGHSAGITAPGYPAAAEAGWVIVEGLG